MNRRSLLASFGAATGALSTGCLSSLSDRFEPSVRLGWFVAHNFDTESHLFRLEVQRDGTRVHTSSHKIPSRDGNYIHSAIAECDWGTTPSDYTVVAQVDGNQRVEESITEFVDSRGNVEDCVIADAQYYADGLRFQLGGGCHRDYDGMCSFTTRWIPAEN